MILQIDYTAIIELLVAGFAIIVGGYVVSLLLNKRVMDSVQTTVGATLAATQSLISQSVYYGAYERAETLRTVASIIGIDQIRDTALQFQNNRNNVYQVEYYPPQNQNKQ